MEMKSKINEFDNSFRLINWSIIKYLSHQNIQVFELSDLKDENKELCLIQLPKEVFSLINKNFSL
jgi:hypothetical protein